VFAFSRNFRFVVVDEAGWEKALRKSSNTGRNKQRIFTSTCPGVAFGGLAPIKGEIKGRVSHTTPDLKTFFLVF